MLQRVVNRNTIFDSVPVVILVVRVWALCIATHLHFLGRLAIDNSKIVSGTFTVGVSSTHYCYYAYACHYVFFKVQWLTFGRFLQTFDLDFVLEGIKNKCNIVAM